ncbi:MAG: hypothetical protein GXY86_03930 [Firmicutes bacterium]|nr:hypothetical protein [Bacillota bacterium]
MLTTINDLENIKNNLPGEERNLFDRYFRVDTTIGRLSAPETMHGWIKKNFGSLEKVESQKIVKVTNLQTMEGSLFNEIRASRPMECKVNDEVRQIIENSEGDPFCKAETGTPADTFGRVKGSHSITASNIAKYDGHHGLVVFEEHNPLKVYREAVTDYFETGFDWANRARQEDPESKYYFFMWNCLWKSGASIIHGHAQMTMTKGMHYPKVEALRRAALNYSNQYGTCYFGDLFQIHKSLGLGWEWDGGVKGMAYLTPIKEKEIILFTDKPGAPLYHAVHAVLEKYMAMCAISFNLALYIPPLADDGEDWSNFPAIVRIVDRGDPNNKTADFGAMELYAASVISSDPFRVAEKVSGGQIQ